MKRIKFFVFLLFIAALCVPYHAAAQSYPAPTGDFFRQEGIGSWYGPGFDGRPTASGEIFDSSQFTAAHPDLPFGTYLIVTNRHNNKQVTVRVNDRGPFVSSRIIDVSKAAAEYLDMIITGTAPLIIETLRTGNVPSSEAPVLTQVPTTPQQTIADPQASVQVPTSPFAATTVETYDYNALPPPETIYVYTPPPPIPVAPPSEVASAPSVPLAPSVPPVPSVPSAPLPSVTGVKFIPAMEPEPGKLYKLQVGSYKDPRSAVAAFERLRNVGLGSGYERYEDFYRVVVKGVRGTEVRSVADKLDIAGFHEVVIREDR
jgi:rare lipoprotein A